MFGKPIRRREETLLTTTIRQFDGGKNVIDADLNLSSDYAKELSNIERGIDGSLSIRPGTRLLVDFSDLDSAAVVNITYFSERVIAVLASGRVVSAQADGTKTSHSTAWAGSAFTHVSFAPFNGELVIVNGVDKPLLMADDFTVDFLEDLATTSNVNTPICRYACTHQRYLVMANDPTEPDALYISHKDASGTWPGDPAPNSAVKLNLGSIVPVGSAEIRGIASFRDRLVIGFDECVILAQLDVYVTSGATSVHTPNFDDIMPGFGCSSHRTMVSLGNDLLFCDFYGVVSLAKTIISNSLEPARASELVDPEIVALLQQLTTGTLEDKMHAVYDQRNRRYMLFIPNANDPTETICYSYTTIRQLKINAWATLRGWNWAASCRTALGNVLFARGTQIFYYDFEDTDSVADYKDDQETFSDDTVYTDGYGNSPTDDEDSGVPINFTWELPWADFNKRMYVKHSRYIGLDTTGTAAFTFQMFVDNLYQDRDGELTPTLEMDFVGGSHGGFGADGYGDVFGGGRITSDERLYAWTTPFKLAKFRVTGETKEPLRIVSISVAYQRGSIRR